MNLSKIQQVHACVYTRCENTMTIIAMYVDGLIVLSKKKEEIKSLKLTLTTKFKMKDTGKLHYCMEINIEQNEKQKRG